GPLDYTHSGRLTTRRIRVRATAVALVLLLLLVDTLPPHLGAQGAGPRPAVVVAATSRLLATLRASELVTLVDSSVVAVAVAAAEAGGNPCGNECALAV